MLEASFNTIRSRVEEKEVMRKCSYCAQDVQDEAIICRYCGQDLRAPVEQAKAEPIQQQDAKPVQVPVSKLAANDLVTTFIGWWLISALAIWLWRKLGASGFALLSLGVLLLAGMYTNATLFSAPALTPTHRPTQTHVPTQTPTKMPRPTNTPRPTDTPTLRPFPCNWWYDLQKDNIGDSMCVQGLVQSSTGNNPDSGITRIYFENNLPKGSIWTVAKPTSFYFVDEKNYYSDLKIGACIAAEGLIRVNDDGTLFMRIQGDLLNC